MTHARLYVAADFQSVPELVGVLSQSVDIEHFVEPAFGIGTARALTARASLRPVEGESRQFLIHFESITVEAQNALLKLFEDPPETAIFHVVVKRSDMLLPTVLSRLQLISDTLSEKPDEQQFTEFMSLNMGERLAEIAKRTKAKDVSWIESIVTGAESLCATSSGVDRVRGLASVIFVRQYLGNRGASAKMLLESLALDLPQKL